ncbi:MAG: hypothetical protein ACLVJH_15090 [Faecalibacterium prausnitzii]
MKRAYTNGILLDGTEQMEPVQGKVLLTENDKITAIADASVSLDGYEVIDLHGGYLCPGLINLHVHLAGNGKPSAKPRDNAALVRKILSNRPDPRHRIPAGVQLCQAGAAGRCDHRAHRGRHCGF